MGFAEAVRTCFRKYVTFSGRASRPEYWWFVLFVFLGSIAASMLDAALFGTRFVEVAPGQVQARSDGPLASIFSLVTFIPLLAAGWRRMHDSGRSGIYLLYPLIVMFGVMSFIGFVAGFDAVMAGDLRAILAGASGVVIGIGMFVFLISPLIVIWWLTRPTEAEPNRFGPPPQAAA